MELLAKILPEHFQVTKPKFITFMILGLVYISIFLFQKPNYFLSDDLDFFLGIIFSPYIIRQISTEKSKRFLGWSLLFFLILLVYRSNTFYWFAFGFSIIFLIESFFFKLNSLAVLLLIACSAVFRHVAQLWTFPIRLKMTEVTGGALSSLGFPVEAAGNVIYMSGQPFEVAPACMGLDMLVTSFVLALMVLAYFERKYEMTIPLWKASFYCGIGMGLAIFSNLVRLITLVLFRVMPENFLHDVLGILSLCIYMLLPFFFLMRFVFRKNKKPENQEQLVALDFHFVLSSFFKKGFILHLILMSLLWWTGQQFSTPIQLSDPSFSKIEIQGFKKSLDEEGVLKFENDSLLLYLKPPVRVFQGTHDPRFCWKGSGYTLSNIEKKEFGDHEVYTAILTQGEDRLFTAWWLDNGHEKTISEWNWRRKTLEGESEFRLINLTAEKLEILDRAVLRILKLSLFEE